ncbi:BhlA/UviB family holin-like peptide [Gracilibacillus massiliensis]|uniref:BhlA/UviB family holin-like peptide n=1 Tax=Gracilibacillus massiliensis TaxID=1564956 RepID=UPI00071DCADB
MEKVTIENVLQYFLTHGPFAALFVWLLIYVMKANQEREMRLQNLLKKFSEKYDDVIDELKDIKNRLLPKVVGLFCFKMR